MRARRRTVAWSLIAVLCLLAACRTHPAVALGARGTARCADPSGDARVPRGLGAVASADLIGVTIRSDGRQLVAHFDAAGLLVRAIPRETLQYWTVRLISPSGGYLGELQVSLTPAGYTGLLGRETLPPLVEPVRVGARAVSVSASVADIPGLPNGFRWVAASTRTSLRPSAPGTISDFCPVQDDGLIILKTVYFPDPPKQRPVSPFTKQPA